MRRVRTLGVTVFVVVVLGAGAVSQSTAAHPTTIDCPPKTSLAVDGETAIAVPGPIGHARSADVAATMTRVPVWRIDGVIKHLSLGGTLEVSGVTLQIDRRSVILVDCRRAVIRELLEGSMVTALYEERDGRNLILVIEGESDDR